MHESISCAQMCASFTCISKLAVHTCSTKTSARFCWLLSLCIVSIRYTVCVDLKWYFAKTILIQWFFGILKKKTHWFENIVKLDILVVTPWRYLRFFEIFHNSYVIAMFLHISILMLQVDITILLVNILILHVDIFDRNISCTQKAEICHHTKDYSIFSIFHVTL